MDSTVFALILAAGSGTRFGGDKQLATFRGETLILRAINSAQAAFAEKTLLILGTEWHACLAAVGVQQGFFSLNDSPERGMSASIRIGIRALSDKADAVVIALCDQPLVSAGHLAQLVEAWDGSPTGIVCSAAERYLGPPALFGADHFQALTELEGDQGARALIAANTNRVVRVRCEAAAADIDTIEDLERLTGSDS
ncbi:MAG: nucleotidyltransferase family protein [Pseudomonadota bacterium]